MSDKAIGFRWEGFRNFVDDRAAWSEQTFGPGDRTVGLLKHIRKELTEIEANPSDLEEWIDLINLALDGAARACGATGSDVARMLLLKMNKNRLRKWPDWRTLSPSEPSEHIKED